MFFKDYQLFCRMYPVFTGFFRHSAKPFSGKYAILKEKHQSGGRSQRTGRNRRDVIKDLPYCRKSILPVAQASNYAFLEFFACTL